MSVIIRTGVPLTGGKLVAAAKELGYPVLFSANAFAKVYGPGHPRSGSFSGFKTPDPEQFAGLDAALDSAGFVAAAKYGDFRWSVEDYLQLVASHPWAFWASMDYCCEPQVANDRPLRLLRMAATAQMLTICRARAAERGLSMPMPVLQGWTAAEYAQSAEWMPVPEWPALVGLGSVCRRHVHGENGILAILDAIDPHLPPHVKLHLFGVKSSALAKLVDHPRLYSVDSMAWDVAARAERRTGRDMAFRIQHMQAWTDRQRAIVETAAVNNGRAHLTAANDSTQMSLFPAAEFAGGVIPGDEACLLEALTMGYVDLLLDNNIEYADAVSGAVKDGAHSLAIWRTSPSADSALAHIDDEIFSGVGRHFEQIAGDRPTLHRERQAA